LITGFNEINVSNGGPTFKIAVKKELLFESSSQ
jgi:hypothetical protein